MKTQARSNRCSEIGIPRHSKLLEESEGHVPGSAAARLCPRNGVLDSLQRLVLKPWHSVLAVWASSLKDVRSVRPVFTPAIGLLTAQHVYVLAMVIARYISRTHDNLIVAIAIARLCCSTFTTTAAWHLAPRLEFYRWRNAEAVLRTS